ncbi:transmembrane protein, putative [Medicago truncatula]|uniref:Transmembrane protein, putative n=1 Tax=Medicago truncatula TaxID=3880 RepID=G7I8F1_MEDTR|nr:transmembrane protein, putative [Medicago truncatula]
MAPYIEAIDSQQFSYFIASRKKPIAYICFKMRFFSHTIEPTLFVLMVCIFIYSSVPFMKRII